MFYEYTIDSKCELILEYTIDSKCELILEWARTKPFFDTSFVEDVMNSTFPTTDAQVDGINNIIQKWSIPLSKMEQQIQKRYELQVQNDLYNKKIQKILEYASQNPSFNTNFILSLHKQGENFTEKQRKAVDNIIQRFKL